MIIIGFLAIIEGLVFLSSYFIASQEVFNLAISISMIISGIVFIWADSIQKLLENISETNSALLNLFQKNTMKDLEDSGYIEERLGEAYPNTKGLSDEVKGILLEAKDRNLELIINRFDMVRTNPKISVRDELIKKIVIHEKELLRYLYSLKDK